MSVSLAPQRIPLLVAKSTAANSGTSVPVNVQGRDEIVIYFQSNGATTGGTLFIEEADYDQEGPVYAGTWSKIGPTITANDFTGTAMQAAHVSPNTYSFIRVRIATDITGGGTVTATLKMQ